MTGARERGHVSGRMRAGWRMRSGGRDQLSVQGCVGWHTRLHVDVTLANQLLHVALVRTDAAACHAADCVQRHVGQAQRTVW